MWDAVLGSERLNDVPEAIKEPGCRVSTVRHGFCFQSGWIPRFRGMRPWPLTNCRLDQEAGSLHSRPGLTLIVLYSEQV